MWKIYLWDTLICGGGWLGNPTLVISLTDNNQHTIDLSWYNWIYISSTKTSIYHDYVLVRIGSLVLDNATHRIDFSLQWTAGDDYLTYKWTSLDSLTVYRYQATNRNYNMSIYWLS